MLNGHFRYSGQVGEFFPSGDELTGLEFLDLVVEDEFVFFVGRH